MPDQDHSKEQIADAEIQQIPFADPERTKCEWREDTEVSSLVHHAANTAHFERAPTRDRVSTSRSETALSPPDARQTVRHNIR